MCDMHVLINPFSAEVHLIWNPKLLKRTESLVGEGLPTAGGPTGMPANG